MEKLKPNIINDFKTFLEQELSRRSAVNPNYSLRAFARDLGVDSSFLSKLLNGKRSMTPRTILSLAPRLSLSEEQIQNFIQNANGRRRRYGGPFTSRQGSQWQLALLAAFEMKQEIKSEADIAWLRECLDLAPELTSTISVPVSKSRLSEAVGRIKKFRQDLENFLNEPHEHELESQEKDNLFHLAISIKS